jgi:ABC-type multidrug transport system ATPase subunit
MAKIELEVSGIIKQFKTRTLLSDVYIKCKTGEVVGVLGRNGSGKSTLMQIIFGTMPTENKTIRINNTSYRHAYLNSKLISYLPQKNFLPKHLGIKKLIGIFIDDKEVRSRILSDKRIANHIDKNVAALSGGELRYLEILLVVSLPVRFVLLDEPFSGIEPIYKEMIKELVNRNKQDKGFLITDHDYRNIIDASDLLYLIDNGVCRKINNYSSELEEYKYLPKGTFTRKETQEPETKPFVVDKQTLQDLDIFGVYQQGEIVKLFSETATHGGIKKLSAIIKSPSRNIHELESRRDAIKFFDTKKISLEINKKQISAIEYYLESSIPIYKNTFGSSFISYLKNYFSPSSDYYTVMTGIRNIMQFLIYLRNVVCKLQEKGTTDYLSELSFSVQDIITQREIQEILDSEEWVFPIGKLDHFFRKNNDLQKLLDIVYELDVLESVGRVVSKRDLFYPEYINSEAPVIDIKGLFHPLVNDAVSNDFLIDRRNNLCFLTGANMSGKSTFLKSFGIAVYLAHIGFPVPASEMKTTLFNGMVTTINLPDNISLGYSHFYNEVKRVRDIASSIRQNGNMVVILDELFKGTNVKDASEACLLITSALSKIKNCLFIVSTHHVDIAEKLAANKNIFFNHLEYHIVNEAPAYTYKLMKGVSDDRAGLLIIKQEGILEILDDAENSDQLNQRI